MELYPNATEETVRGKIRAIWSKMAKGYDMMEQRPIQRG